MDPLTVHVIHAFSSDPKSGNPAGICVLNSADELDTTTMQAIAADMNYSETAFVKPIENKPEHYNLRWFTPTTEVDLCGHATLASTFTLLKLVNHSSKISKLHFETRSGLLTCQEQDGKILMEFPQFDFRHVDKTEEPWTDFSELFAQHLPVEEMVFSDKSGKLAIVLKSSVSRNELESLSPNFSVITLRFPGGPVRGVIVTVKNENGANDYDFLSRYFAPWLGIPEDPVTGSAHCLLAPYWSGRLGKDKLFARQCSSSGGELWLKTRSDRIVEIAGEAVLKEKRILYYRP